MYNILYILIYSESAVLQVEKVLKKIFYAEKQDFSKNFTISAQLWHAVCYYGWQRIKNSRVV